MKGITLPRLRRRAAGNNADTAPGADPGAAGAPGDPAGDPVAPGDRAADPAAPGAPGAPADPAESPAGADLERIANDVADAAPDPNPDAILRAEQDRDRAARDDERKARGERRRPRSRVARTTDDERTAEQRRLDAEAFRQACRRSGEATIDSVVLAATTLFGREWWYDDPHQVPGTDPPVWRDEKAELRRVYADTFEHYGWKSTPTWLGIVIVTGSYAAIRLQRPVTKQRVQTLKEKLASWWARRQVRKGSQPAPTHQAPPPAAAPTYFPPPIPVPHPVPPPPGQAPMTANTPQGSN